MPVKPIVITTQLATDEEFALREIKSFLDQIKSFELPSGFKENPETLPLSALRFEDNN